MTATDSDHARPPAGGAAPSSGAHAAPPADFEADAAATIALTLLTLAGVFSLGRLFVSHSYVAPVVTVAIAMHAVAWACRRQRLRGVTTALISIGALILVVTWVVLPETTSFGLPLGSTWHAVHLALQEARTDFRSVTAPAPVTRGFELVTAATVGILALLADWAAFRMRTTLEAVIPSFTLFVFSASLGTHQHRTQAIFIELAAILAFVVVHQATVDRESSAWFANRTDGVLGSVAKAGLVIGVVALVLTVNLSFRLPGSQSRALIAWRAADRASGTRNALSPLVDIRSRILDHNGTEAFTVKSNAPSYWRIMALDSFDGTDWTSNNTYGSVRHGLPRESTSTPSGARVEQDFTIEQLTQAWLPAAYQPARIDGITGVSYDPQSGSLLYDHDTTPGLTYHVTSVLNVGQLDAAKLEKAGAAPSGPSLEQYLKLPLSRISPQVVDLARRIAGSKTTEYDKAIALQNYLRSDLFQYNENFDPRATGSDALDYFLFTSRQGYCQQFAGAYAVLARLVGLPTRLAVGWTWGDQDNAGVWHVRLDQAHTWPEVYFSGIGWVPFEPTSSRGIPNAQAYTGVPAEQAGSSLPGGSSALPSSTTPTTTAPGQAPGRPNIPKNELGNQGAGVSRHSHRRSAAATIGIWLLAGLVLVLIWAVAMVVMAWVVRRIRRRVLLADAAAVESGAPLFQPPKSRFWWSRWLAQSEARTRAEPSTGRRGNLKRAVSMEWLRPLVWWRSPPPADEAVVFRAEALLAWAEATELLTWWGVRRRPSETYLEYGRRAVEGLRLPLSFDPDASRAVLGLARAGTMAEFSAQPISPAEASQTAEALAALKRALISCAPALQKARFVLDPRVTLGRH